MLSAVVFHLSLERLGFFVDSLEVVDVVSELKNAWYLLFKVIWLEGKHFQNYCLHKLEIPLLAVYPEGLDIHGFVHEFAEARFLGLDHWEALIVKCNILDTLINDHWRLFDVNLMIKPVWLESEALGGHGVMCVKILNLEEVVSDWDLKTVHCFEVVVFSEG